VTFVFYLFLLNDNYHHFLAKSQYLIGIFDFEKNDPKILYNFFVYKSLKTSYL